MKLFTKDIDKKLFAQYPKGSDIDSQVAVAKIFNPYGRGRWFLLNSDPQNPDYVWAIVQMGDIVEMGSVLRSELESIRVSPFRLPLERDLGFRMVNAGELYRGLLQGKFYKKGGWIDGYEEGGFVDKTDEELKGMNDDELFAYLDAKAAYMKQYARPLSSFKAKNFAANSAAIQFQNEGTSKLDANFPSLSKINEQATKDYQETIAKKADKMAMGGKVDGAYRDKLDKYIVKKYVGKTINGYKARKGFDDTTLEWELKSKNIELIAMPFMTPEHNLNFSVFKNGDEVYKNDRLKFPLTKDLEKDAKKYIELLKPYFEKYYSKMAMGGKVTFNQKVKAIQKTLLKRKKVAPKVQKDYGKTYNKAEALDSAKRIAGSIRAKYELKKK